MTASDLDHMADEQPFEWRSVLDDPLDAEQLSSLRHYRLGRVQEALARTGCGAAVLLDPCNIRYATDSRNMSVWTLHNRVRCAFVPVEGLPVLFEFGARQWPVPAEDIETVGEVRPISGWTHFYAGAGKPDRLERWASEIAALVSEHCGAAERVAFDHLDPQAVSMIADRGLTIVDGEALMERARSIKSAEEVICLRHSIDVAEIALDRIRRFLRPGVTENELWSILHQTNIAHNGEWIETRLLNSGPRTNPWMQESSSRVIESGDLVALDTDMIGPHAYCADVSRTFLCGPSTATAEQRRLYRASWEQLQHNIALLQPGRSLRSIVEDEWEFPPEFLPYRYGVAHGVGLKDEYPFLPNRADIDTLGDPDMLLKPSTVLSVESYIGVVGGDFGVKLEDQVLVTEHGPELLSHFPFEDDLLRE